jgi:predicted component of type VI protein secretion system
VTALRSLWIVLGSAAGLATGWVLAQRYLERHQAALFSPKLRRRHAALGYLAGHPDPETLRVLLDYLTWEQHPVLRRRARRVVRELEHALG